MLRSWAVSLFVLVGAAAQAVAEPVLPPLTAPVGPAAPTAPPALPGPLSGPITAPRVCGPGGCGPAPVAPGAMALPGPPVGPVGPVGCAPCGPTCRPSCQDICRRVREWFCYRPLRAPCHSCHHCACGWPFFTVYDYFCEGCIEGAGCCAAPPPCGPGGAGACSPFARTGLLSSAGHRLFGLPGGMGGAVP